MKKQFSEKKMKNLTIIPESSEVSKDTSRCDTLLNSARKKFPDFENNNGKLFLRPFSKFNRKLIFLLLFFLNIVMNMDHGTIPAAIKKFQPDLKLNVIQIGLLGTFVFFGLILASLISGTIFQNYSSKWIVIVSLMSISNPL